MKKWILPVAVVLLLMGEVGLERRIIRLEERLNAKPQVQKVEPPKAELDPNHCALCPEPREPSNIFCEKHCDRIISSVIGPVCTQTKPK